MAHHSGLSQTLLSELQRPTSLPNPYLSSTMSQEFTELTHIHESLRYELADLCSRSVSLLQQLGKLGVDEWRNQVQRLVAQFDFFFVVFCAHSKAEDEIIIPAIQQRVRVKEDSLVALVGELEKEHEGHSRTFKEIQMYLLHFRGEGALRIDQRNQTGVLGLVSNLVELLTELKHKILLHFRKEEELLLPLLLTHFTGDELNELVGKILGERSADEVQGVINMLNRGLGMLQRQSALVEMKKAASGTQFEQWLSYSLAKPSPTDLPEISMEGRTDLQPTTLPDGSALGCRHYERNNKVFAPCCKRFFTCRRCHDEHYCQLENASSAHELDRHQVTTMCCMLCSEIQPISQRCRRCHSLQARYFCAVCNLFENRQEVYHCPYCNVCRVGHNLGVDFFHCMKCNACVSTSRRQHHCRQQMLQAQCPICCQVLANSTEVIKENDCGHFMHLSCYERYVASHFQCPLCRKAIKDMTPQWLNYDAAILNYLNAKALRNESTEKERRDILCNDCQEKMTIERVRMEEVPYNTIPFKCHSCHSYNTSTL